jgi:hypothetical protein
MAMVMVPVIPENYYYDLAVNYIAFAPWAIWGALWVAYLVSKDGAFWIISASLTFSSAPLYVALVYFNDVRPGLFLPSIERWSFPNMEIAAVSSFFVYVLFFRIYYKISVTYCQWLMLGLFFLLPPVVHLVAAQTEFWKVAISVGYGIGVALIVCPLLWTNQRVFAYLFTLPYFWTWFGPSILCRDEPSRTLYDRLRTWRQTESERARASRGLLAGPSSILLSK